VKDQITDAAVRATPAGLVIAWNKLSDIPAEKWLTYVTIGYVLLQAVALIRNEFLKRRRAARGRK
jgi:hypothetical protein